MMTERGRVWTTKREHSTAGRDVEKDRDGDKRQILKSVASGKPCAMEAEH